MEKYTRLIKKEEKNDIINSNTFINDDIEIIEYNNKNIIKDKDKIVILPYLKDEGRILMRYDKLSNFNYRLKDKIEYKNEYNYLTSIKYVINDNEDLYKQIRKLLYDECGIILSSTYTINIDKSVFKNEDSTGFYYLCILELNYNDFKQTNNNNNNDSINKIVKLNLNDIFSIKIYDLVTEYLFLKLKYDYNLK